MTIEERPTTGQLTLMCPDCGAVVTTSPGRRSAGDFCPQCDFPMFWARPSDLVQPVAGSDDAQRRLPGVDGTRAPTQVSCPSCAELNPPDAAICLRCAQPMVLATPAPAVEPPAPLVPAPVVVVEEIVKCEHWPAWHVALLSALVTMTVCAIIMVIVITRG